MAGLDLLDPGRAGFVLSRLSEAADRTGAVRLGAGMLLTLNAGPSTSGKSRRSPSLSGVMGVKMSCSVKSSSIKSSVSILNVSVVA